MTNSRHNADVSSTLAAILHGVAKELFHFSGIDGLDDSKIENLNFLLEIFKNVVATGQVEISAVMSSLKTLLSQYLDSSINFHDSNNDLEKNIFEITCELLRFVSQRYSLEFDKTIKSFMEEKSTQLSLVKFQHLLNAAFHHAVYHKIQDNGLGLFLSLNDSSEIIRREGLQVFGKIFGQSGTINKDDEDLRSLAQSVVKLFETDLYNNETMLLLFTYDVLSPLFKILPDQVQDIVDNIPFSLAHLYHRLSVDLKALDAIISLLQSLYHQDLLRDLCSEGSNIDFLLNKLFGILLFIASMIKTMPDDSCKILDAFTLALDNLSQYFPLLSNKLSSHISSDVQPYLQVISLITQRSTPRLMENSSNCLPLLIRLYFVIHQYQTAILVNDQQRESLRILYEQTFLSLLDLSLSLCENLIPKSKTTQGRNSLIAILSLTMSWININYNYKIYGVLQLSQATFLSMNLVLLKLFNFWKQLHPVTDRKLNHSIDDCFLGYISFPSQRSLSFQLLLSLLSLIASGEDVAQVASGLKSCLETFFPNDYVTVLITIATADISAQSPHNLPGTGSLDDNFQNYESQLLFDDEHRSIFSPHFAFQPTEKAETYITSTAQLSALDTLAGYLSHLKSMSDVCVVSLLPLILSNLQSESQEIRQATADLLSSIVNRTENHRSISTFLKGKNSIPTVTINDFYRAISDILQKTPHDLPMMISTLQTVLNSYPDVISILFNVIRVLNWKRPTLTSRIFLVTVSKQTFTSIWNSCSKYLLDLVPVYNHETADSFRQLAHLIVAMSNQSFLNSQSDCKNGAQINDLTECYLKFLHDRSEKTLSSTICHEILQSISRVSKDKTWVDALPLTDREALFVGMMEELERNAQVDFQTPLCSIIIPMDLGFKYLRQAFESIRDIFKKYSVVSEEISPENGDVHLNGGGVSQPTVRGHKLVTNLTIPLQKLGWEIEIISSLYRKLMEEIEIISIDHPDYSTLSQSCCVLFDLLHMLNTQQIKKILSVNYLRNNILELLCYSISKLKIQINSSKSKTQTKSSSSSSSNIYYSSERIQNDIQRIFKCLELSTTLDTQKYSLELLSLLLNISPSHIHSTILLLTKILSGNILSNTISFENTNNLVSNILKAVISISNSHQESSSSIVLPQDILEPYFHTYQMISSQKRIALLSIISERYDPTIAPICISLLLSHVLISYSMIDESRDQNISEKENDEIFILLSRSAQRKANRMIRTSQSEEFFNLALRYNLQFANPSNQINCLIVMTNIVKKLFSISLESHSNGHGHDPHPHQSEENIAVEYSGCTQYLFSPVQYIKYTNSFLSNENSMNSSNTTPAMIVLQLEYILEFIENSSFHDHLLSILFDSSTGSLTNFGYEIQKLFLLFSESILELLSYLTYLQHHYSSKKNSSSLFSINLKNQHIIISSKEFLKYSSNLCLNIMHSLQNLLDGPTFVVILQELLSNENISIRQKSLEILSDRLQNLDRRRGKIDVRNFYFFYSLMIFLDGAVFRPFYSSQVNSYDLFIYRKWKITIEFLWTWTFTVCITLYRSNC